MRDSEQASGGILSCGALVTPFRCASQTAPRPALSSYRLATIVQGTLKLIQSENGVKLYKKEPADPQRGLQLPQTPAKVTGRRIIRVAAARMLR